MRDYVIGIDVGGTRIRMGLFDSGMQLISEQLKGLGQRF